MMGPSGFSSEDAPVSTAVSALIRYLGIRQKEVPAGIRGLRNRLDFLLSSSGVFYREVRLPEGWQLDAMGPMIGSLRKTGAAVALLPRRQGGYEYVEPETGGHIHITERNAADIDGKALLFYRPLPMRKLELRDLLRYMAGCLTPRDLAGFVFSALAVALVGLMVPGLNRILMGPVIENGSVRLLFAAVSFLFFITVGSVLLSVIRALFLDRIRRRLSLNVSAAAMMRVFSLPMSFFREHSAGELSQYISSMEHLCSALVNSVFSTTVTSVFSLVYLAQIFTFAPGLVWPSLAVTLLTSGASLLCARAKRRTALERMEYEARERSLVYAIVNGIRKIRLSSAESRAFSQWEKQYEKRARLVFYPPAVIRLFPVYTQGIGLMGTAVIYYLAVRTKVSAADYYAFNAAYAYISSAFAALAAAAQNAASVRPFFDRIRPLLSAEPENSDPKDTVASLSGNIRVSHVAFGYDLCGKLLFEDLDLTIAAGQSVAVVGRTGSGKSTLVRLLLGFESPLRGKVCYDGKDLQQLDIRSLRRLIGTVMQDSRLFSGSIFENLSIAAPGLKPEDAWEAVEMAAIAGDIRDMPMGMSTVLSDGGSPLSGGQRQRLMIARALVSRPKILILDEATSALDSITQRRISETLDRLDCTRIIIAHRLSTIRLCDRILVLEGGRIAEDGTYDELIAAGGLFAGLAAQQRDEDEKMQ